MGEGKALPGLTVCKFREKLIPGLMCMFTKVSISSEIMTEALKYLDNLNVFAWLQYGPTTFILLDSHGSRLQLPFLKYTNSSTNDKQRKLIFTLGTKKYTDVWQVGDSCRQHGCWKMAMNVEKDALLNFKHRHAFESTDFDRCDIVPLIKRAWKKSFSIRNNNSEATIDRGWFHLERRLMKEPVIFKKQGCTISNLKTNTTRHYELINRRWCYNC